MRYLLRGAIKLLVWSGYGLSNSKTEKRAQMVQPRQSFDLCSQMALKEHLIQASHHIYPGLFADVFTGTVII